MDIGRLDADTLEGALTDAPTTVVPRGELDAGLPVVDALLRSGLAASRNNARKLMTQGSVYVNGARLAGDRDLVAGDALHGRWIVLRKGRANQHVLAVTDSA